MKIGSFFDGSLQLGEGIFFDTKTAQLWWVDILGRTVFRADADGQHHTWTLPELVGFVLPHHDGSQQWVGLKSGPHATTLIPGQEPVLVRLDQLDATATQIRVNDGGLSTSGDLFVTTMDMDIKQPLGRLIRYDRNGIRTDLATDFVIGNGPVWLETESAVVVAESVGHANRARGLYKVHLETPTPTETHFIDWPYEGVPDGASLDATGTLWVGAHGSHQIRQFSLSGKLLRTIDLPARNVTKVARVDNRLYVTSALDEVPDALRQQFPLTGHVLIIDDLD